MPKETFKPYACPACKHRFARYEQVKLHIGACSEYVALKLAREGTKVTKETKGLGTERNFGKGRRIGKRDPSA